MQALTAAPREQQDPERVRALLHAADLRVARFGADLLDTRDQHVDDLTRDLRSARVSWNGEQDLHRTCELTVGRELAWDRDRIRLWQELRSKVVGITARFWCGVFIPTRPASAAEGSRTPVHVVKGWDKLRLLRSPVGDTWATRWEESGQSTFVGAEARRLVAAAGYRGPLVLPAQAETIMLPEPMVWPLDDGATTYLRVLIDLLRAGGLSEPFADHAGVVQAQMLTPVTERPVEWVLDADDRRTTMLGRIRTRTQDLGEIPNAWRFVNQSATDREPVTDEGIYDPPDNESSGPTSIRSRDFRHLAVVKVDAADQAALIRIGDEQRARDMRAAGGRAMSVSPLPLLGHRDLFEVRDSAHGAPVLAVAAAWGPMDLSGSPTATPLLVEEVPA